MGARARHRHLRSAAAGGPMIESKPRTAAWQPSGAINRRAASRYTNRNRSSPVHGRRLRLMNAAEQQRLLADVEAFCEEIRPTEELCYVEHRFNDQLIP